MGEQQSVHRSEEKRGAETAVADRAAIGDGLHMTEEQYLALDEATDGNYEFYEGYVVMLSPPSSAYNDHAIIDPAGGSVARSALCARLASLIDQALRDGACPVRSSDVKVKMPSSSHYFHPGVSVASDNESRQIRTNPVVITEALHLIVGYLACFIKWQWLIS